jgi:hypothetical protein
MRRTLLSIVAVACMSASAPAHGAEGWRATRVVGEVRVAIAGAAAVPLKESMVVASDAVIESAASGSATLVRGDDRIVIAPNSRLRMPAKNATGVTRIIEEFGELFFQVGKGKQPHFRVDTPLLAATVKGTAFVVKVDHEGANVEVREGLVQVEGNASSDKVHVAAGRSARVTAAQPMNLYLDHTLVPPHALRLGAAASGSMLADQAGAPSDILVNRRSHQPSNAAASAKATPAWNDFALPANKHGAPANLVIDSTLSGIGMGILAAALAIVVLSGSRRRPGLLAAKAKRAAGAGPAQS